SADLACQEVVYFVMSWNRGSSVVGGVEPPGMLGTLAKENAVMIAQMLDERMALQISMLASSYGPFAAASASLRFISSASERADRRFSRSSALVSPWEFTPGISSIHPIHQSPSCLITARYLGFIQRISSIDDNFRHR